MTATLERRCVTIKELAEITKISRTRLFAYMSEGVLPSFKGGRTRLVRVDDIDPFLDRLAGRS